MINVNITHIMDKNLITHTEVARLMDKKPEDMVRAIGNLTLAAPDIARYFQITGDGEYLMEKDGFMILTSGISGQKAFITKMEVVKALENRNDKQLTVIDERSLCGKNFRMYGTPENPMFLAVDVAEWIDYSKTGQGYYDVSKMLKTVDDDEKVTTNIVRSDGKAQKRWLLTEDGLYEVLMQSRKPIAKEFKKEVKKILKEIRKTGAYVSPDVTPMDNPGQMQAMLQLNSQVIAAMNKQTEMIGCIGKLAAEMANGIKAMAEDIAKVTSLPAQKPQQMELLPHPTAKVHGKCITMSDAAKKFGFFTHKTGKPNASVIADILKYGCHIKLHATWGRDDEYVVVQPTAIGEDIVPCVWLKPSAVEKIEEYLSGDGFNSALNRYYYKRKYKGKAKGDWKYDAVQYRGKREHIIADKDGNLKKYIA